MAFIRNHPILARWIGAVLLLVVVALVIARLYLGAWLLGYVNNVLHNIKGYDGSVESISIDLYRGAYRINKLVLNKKDGNIPTPFVIIDLADLSIQWSALFHGRIVSDIELTKPVINFAVNKSASQTGAEVDWTKPIKDLMPVDINHVNFKEGTVTYQDFSSTPKVNLYIHDMSGDVQNLRNVENPAEPLPSTLVVRGGSIGGGRLEIKGRLNILKQIPDMLLLTKLENAKLPAINNYTQAYAAFDFKSGNLNIYLQLDVKDSQVSGYIKLLAQHVAVDVVKSSNPIQLAWNVVVAAVIKVFTNRTKDQFATRADLQGSINDITTDTWSALATIVRNAFISALEKGLDQNGEVNLIENGKK